MSVISCKKNICHRQTDEKPYCCAVCSEHKCMSRCDSYKNIICKHQQVHDSLEEYIKWVEEQNSSKCNSCEEVFDLDDLREGADGELYCDDCFWDLFSTCDNCGTVMNQDDAYSGEGGDGIYCGDCWSEYYTSCNECGEATHNDNTRHTTGDTYICESCAEDHDTCVGCGDVIVGVEPVVIDGDSYCPNCANRRRTQ